MEVFVRGFIKSSLVWLGVGVVIGLSMAVLPGQAMVYRPAHVHANLLGFVSMMIFGVAYHVVPRFSGNPLYSRTLPRLHLVIQNSGLALMVSGFAVRLSSAGVGAAALQIGAAASAVGAFLFIYNLWRTLDGSPRRAADVSRAAAMTS